MAKEIEMNIKSFKEFLKVGIYDNDDIAYFTLERLEKELNSELKAIYPINFGTPNHKKFIALTDTSLVVAYSKDIDVEKTNSYTKEKYIDKDRIIVIDKIPKSSIEKIELIEHGTKGQIYGGSLELYIDLNVECDKETTIHLNSRRDRIWSSYRLNEDDLMDTIELFAKELA